MWAAIVLVCHLDMAPIFENNLTDQIEIPDRMCYMSMAPALMKDDFVRVPNFQIFSFKCFEWDNHHYKGQSI